MSFAQVVTVMRRDGFARTALESVCKQKPAALPLLVVTPHVSFVKQCIPDFMECEVIEVNEDSPPGKTRNTALEAGKDFDLLLFLDDDDVADPLRQQKQVATFLNTRADIIYGNMQYINEAGDLIPGRKLRSSLSSSVEHELLWRNPIHQSSVAIQPAMAFEVGSYNQSMVRFSDYEFWMRAAAAGASFERSAGCVGGYRLHDGQITVRRGITRVDTTALRVARGVLAKHLYGKWDVGISELSHVTWLSIQELRWLKSRIFAGDLPPPG